MKFLSYILGYSQLHFCEELARQLAGIDEEEEVYPCTKQLLNFLQRGISAAIICLSSMMKIGETAGCATSLRKLKGRPAGFWK